MSWADGQLAQRHERAARAPAIAAPDASIWAGFLLMCLGMFMAILDIQVVATSLPTIQDALGISREAMSWIQTAYLIAEVIAIPLTGLLTRMLSLRWLFVAAVCALHAGVDRLRLQHQISDAADRSASCRDSPAAC